jgi:hypothetical protein
MILEIFWSIVLLALGWLSLCGSVRQGCSRFPILGFICFPLVVLIWWKPYIASLVSWLTATLPGHGGILNGLTVFLLLSIPYLIVVFIPAVFLILLESKRDHGR